MEKRGSQTLNAEHLFSAKISRCKSFQQRIFMMKKTGRVFSNRWLQSIMEKIHCGSAEA